MSRKAGMFVTAALITFLIFTGVALVGGCGGEKEQVKTKEGERPEETTEKSVLPEERKEEPLKSIQDFPNDRDGDRVEAVIKTDKGDIVIRFFPDVAPVTVASFLNLSRSGFYNGTRFHRVEPGFVVQGGDPLSKDPNNPYVGTGGPGYRLPPEFSDRKHVTGTVAMARAQDPASGGSQFYICLGPQPMLDGKYTVFGQVVSGMEVVNQIAVGDVIREIVIRPLSP